MHVSICEYQMYTCPYSCNISAYVYAYMYGRWLLDTYSMFRCTCKYICLIVFAYTSMYTYKDAFIYLYFDIIVHTYIHREIYICCLICVNIQMR